jgi:hypothetical protein
MITGLIFLFLFVVLIIVGYLIYTKLLVSDLTRSQRAFTSLDKANSSMILAGNSSPFNSKLHAEASKEATNALADWEKYFPNALINEPIKAKALLLKWVVLAASVTASIKAIVPKSVAATVASHTEVTTAAVTATEASHTAVTTAAVTATEASHTAVTTADVKTKESSDKVDDTATETAAVVAVTTAALASTVESHTAVTTAATTAAGAATATQITDSEAVVAPVVAAVEAVAPQATYVGCYGDGNDPGVGFCEHPRPGSICNGRAISGGSTQPVPLYKGCIERAQALGHSMMGLQNGNQCFTGNDLIMSTTKYGKNQYNGKPAVCTKVGNNMVGGGYVNAIYTIN